MITGIIFNTCPGIEWARENLSGFGGTEIDGNWYYDPKQAKEAIEKIGMGWRLPTIDELKTLSHENPTWDDELYGCWFGENRDMFLPACGYCDCGNTYDEKEVGNYLSSTVEYYWGYEYVYAMEFNDNGHPEYNSYDVDYYGYSVRLVRDIK